MLKELLEYNFMQNAFLCSILVSIACGIVGTIIILKKLVMLSGGIAHTSFGGVGFGYLVGMEPVIGALIFAVAAALGIGFISRKSHQSPDIATGIFWSAGMALGILFVSFAPGYPPDMTSYLFGDILTVTSIDLLLTLILDILVLFLIFSFYDYLRAYLFDEEFAAVLKMRTGLISILLNMIIALTIVILIRAVGIILVLALLTAPSAVARLFSSNLKTIVLYSVFISLISCFAGLWISCCLHIASGASIVMFSALSYLVMHIAKRVIALRTGREKKTRRFKKTA
jgi:zinc transport system permease protein